MPEHLRLVKKMGGHARCVLLHKAGRGLLRAALKKQRVNLFHAQHPAGQHPACSADQGIPARLPVPPHDNRLQQSVFGDRGGQHSDGRILLLRPCGNHSPAYILNPHADCGQARFSPVFLPCMPSFFQAAHSHRGRHCRDEVYAVHRPFDDGGFR